MDSRGFGGLGGKLGGVGGPGGLWGLGGLRGDSGRLRGTGEDSADLGDSVKLEGTRGLGGFRGLGGLGRLRGPAETWGTQWTRQDSGELGGTRQDLVGLRGLKKTEGIRGN